MKPMNTIAASLLASLLVAAASIAADAPAPAAKWHVEFSGQATTDGEMQFRITPHEGELVMITVKIHQARGSHFIAKDALQAFKAQLPKKRIKSEIVAGDHVLVKAGPGEGDFALELAGSTVQGVRVHIKAS
jgi:hypothetical protein